MAPLNADSNEENHSFRAEDDQIIAEGRCRKYCGAGDRHASRESWGKVDVQIYTHKVRGLTESDFVLAAKIDELYFAGQRAD